MVTMVHRLIFPERADFGDLVGMVTATPRVVPPPCLVWWEVTVGALPPPGRCATAVSGALTQTAPKGTTTLFACVAINRGRGQPWPLF
jgi:hypothetical protein